MRLLKGVILLVWLVRFDAALAHTFANIACGVDLVNQTVHMHKFVYSPSIDHSFNPHPLP